MLRPLSVGTEGDDGDEGVGNLGNLGMLHTRGGDVERMMNRQLFDFALNRSPRSAHMTDVTRAVLFQLFEPYIKRLEVLLHGTELQVWRFDYTHL